MHPDFITLFGHSIKWYGVLTAAGFLAAVYHWMFLARRENLDPHIGSELGIWVIVGGILGARLAYILANLPTYLADPMEMVRIWHGGQIYYGGFILASFSVYLLARMKRFPFLALADFTVTALPLGHGIGRIGCFMNGCCYGTESDLPWACHLADAARHPTQLYETGFNFALYALLLTVYLKRTRDGSILALYMMTYSVGRFLIEFQRGDARQTVGMITTAQSLSVGIFVMGCILWFTLPKRLHADNGHTTRTP